MIVDVGHAGALLPATVAACCVAGARRAAFADLVPSLVMLLSMFDLATGAHLVWPIAWAALLLLAAPLPVIAARRRRVSHGHPVDMVMPLHRSLGLITMAALTVASASHLVAAGPHHGAGPAVVIFYAGFAAFLVYTLGLVARHSLRPRRDVLSLVEVTSMAASLVLMALAA